MIYEVRINPISGSQELVSLAGVSSSTIGCVWKSTDAYVCITDCDDCSLGMVNGSATQLGYNSSASNSSTALGVGATSCCNGIAINGTATDTDAIAIGTTAAADTVAIGNKVVVDTNAVIVGKSATGLSCSVSIGANASSAACSTAIGYCACATNGSVAIGNGATATCGIDIKSNNSEVCISNRQISIGHCINSNDECGFVAGNRINVCSDLYNTVVGSEISFGCDSIGGLNVIIGYGHELVNCAYNGLTVVGALIDECGTDFKGNINDGDVILGSADCAFQLCASNGYLYSAGGSCMMTGRILASAAELPASDCSLLLYYVP